MDKRYQVFVSSTFTDLEEERRHVIQTLMEMDCIPAGMELFPAIDEEQWEFIKKIIDDCDYYLLIIGGRYGSVAEDGLSYTEKEFDYAVKKGLKVTVLVHDEPQSLPLNKSELDPDSREKLTKFIDKATTGRLRRTWSTVKELPGLVSLSMAKTIKTYPATGWVRANNISNETDLRKMLSLQKENEELKNRILELEGSSLEPVNITLVDFTEDFNFKCQSYFERVSSTPATYRIWDANMSWQEIFHTISPYISQFYTEQGTSSLIADRAKTLENKGGTSAKVISQDLKTIGVQLIAYGLITIENLKTTDGKMNLFWKLTEKGTLEMIKSRAIKKNNS